MREELRELLDHHQPEIPTKDRLLILTLITLVEAMDEIAEELETIAHHLREK